ncbi:MAG TPA: bacterial transcriptional activator domain-containing protein [Trebonia sp.]|nr:bacterial transcriptional activator domain-containing protein [Trebonia sp.]
MLSEFLWPDDSAAVSKRYLRQALWKLNAAVESEPGPAGELIETPHSGWLQVNATAVAWADVSDFDRAYLSVVNNDGDRLSDSEGKALEQAVGLYQGELLSGWQQPWCVTERSRYHNAYLVMLEQLAAWCRVRGRYTKGVACATRALGLDATRESAHRELMRLHHAAGNRSLAIRQYQQCADVLAREFGVPPSGPTRDLYGQILGEDAPGSGGTAAALPLARREAAADPVMDARLDEIQATLRELRDFVLRAYRNAG